MDAEPHPCPDHSPGRKPVMEEASPAAQPYGMAPPHLLWETLESAFSGAEIDAPRLYGAPVPGEKRLAGYVAMPVALGLSLMLWGVIVMLVCDR